MSTPTTVTMGGVTYDRRLLLRALRRRARHRGERGQGAIASVVGVSQSVVSRRLRGVVDDDDTGRRIRDAVLDALPDNTLRAAEVSTIAVGGGGGGVSATPTPTPEPEPTPDPKPEPKPEPGPTDPESLFRRLRGVVSTVRAALVGGSGDTVFGPRKTVAISRAFGALLTDGMDPLDALRAAYYVAVSAKEPQDSRMLVDEPFVAEFGVDPCLDIGSDLVPDPDGAGYLHPVVPIVVAMLRAGMHVWLYGPAGNGKSRAARDAARMLGRSHVTTPCHRHVHPEDLLGGKELRGGATVDRLGPWPSAMGDGSVLILEEPSKATAGVLALAHSMLEERRLPVPTMTGDDGDPLVVEAASGFSVVACDNAQAGRDPGAYADVQVMDPALLDRFVMIETGPLPEAVEWGAAREAMQDAMGAGDDAGGDDA